MNSERYTYSYDAWGPQEEQIMNTCKTIFYRNSGYYLAILLFICISCKPREGEIRKRGNVDNNVETPTKREDTGSIWDSVLEYRKLVSDSTMVVSLAEYVNTHNEFDDLLYVPLLAYLYKHHNEEFDEGINHSLYRIIKKEPNIGERIVSYIESFPQDQLSTMREDFFTTLYFEFSEYNEEHQLETSNSDFLELFPFFNNEQYLIYIAKSSRGFYDP